MLQDNVVAHFLKPENNPHAADYTINVVKGWQDKAGKLPRPRTLAVLVNQASAKQLDGPKGRTIFKLLEGDPHLAPEGSTPYWYDPSPKAEERALTRADHYILQSKGMGVETHEQMVAWLAKCDAVSREFLEESLALVHRWNRNGWRVFTSILVGMGAVFTWVDAWFFGVPIALFGAVCALIFPRREFKRWMKALKEHHWNADPEIQESFRELDREFTADHDEGKIRARFAHLKDEDAEILKEAQAEAEAAETEEPSKKERKL